MHFSEVEKRIEAAKQAVMAEAPLLHAEFGRAKGEIKHDGTKVTAIDLAISEHIQRAITEQFPQDQFFSEELAPTEAPVPVVARFSWVLDPIDGTNNYANGIIYCAISLALLERDGLVLLVAWLGGIAAIAVFGVLSGGLADLASGWLHRLNA